MSLYLCVFASAAVDDELEGVEVGSYDDFHDFRTTVAGRLEGGRWGSRFPTLMLHSDCDGDWAVPELPALDRELRTIEAELASLPPRSPSEGWQKAVYRAVGLAPQSLADCFIDVDGERLLGRLHGLVQIALERTRPISFQ
jgi:hypothetical protein